MIYLDNSATTPISPSVLEAMKPYLEEEFGNAGSVYELGRKSAAAIKDAREKVAKLFNSKPEQVIFTSGGSEGNNMVISHSMKEYLRRKNKKHIVISEIEHDSVYKSALKIFKSEGKSDIKDDFYIHFIKTNRDGTVDLSDLNRILDEDENIGLVSVMYVNNETGAVNPVYQIGEMCKDRGILFHTDCVQAAGCHYINVFDIGCDFATISGHKIHAPKGVGAVYIKNRGIIEPLVYGGDYQEFGLRGGTENVASIVGFGRACEDTVNSRFEGSTTMTELRRMFLQSLLSKLQKYGLRTAVHLNGFDVLCGKTLNLRIDGVDSETLVLMLDARGVCISSGSACHGHESEPSRVLLAMGLSEDEARDSIRVSFSIMNTTDDVEAASSILSDCIKTLISIGG